MGQAAFAFDLAQVINGVFLAGSQHRVTVDVRWVCGKREMAARPGCQPPKTNRQMITDAITPTASAVRPARRAWRVFLMPTEPK